MSWDTTPTYGPGQWGHNRRHTCPECIKPTPKPTPKETEMDISPEAQATIVKLMSPPADAATLAVLVDTITDMAAIYIDAVNGLIRDARQFVAAHDAELLDELESRVRAGALTPAQADMVRDAIEALKAGA